jgi:RNA polymerase sigma factor (sigma-70 family)
MTTYTATEPLFAEGKLTRAGQEFVTEYDRFIRWKAHRIARRTNGPAEDLPQAGVVAFIKTLRHYARKGADPRDNPGKLKNTFCKIFDIEAMKEFSRRSPVAADDFESWLRQIEQRAVESPRNAGAVFRLRLLLKCLTAWEAEAVRLKYLRRLTYREVGEALRIKPKSAESRVRKAVRKLRFAASGIRPRPPAATA